ncbi:MAG TPA: hypothetical protein VFS42_05225 [Burkholderiaceae bacterium]|nr:hypothetical protein [Burkholderiaceae bacterium]
MALDEAIERTAKAYARDRLHPAPADVMAQHVGYKNANNGAALQALASLRYYGLMDRSADGMMSVTKAFESYHYAPDEELKRKLQIAWLRSPQVFADLLDKYAQGLPSDPTLRHELITQKHFSPAAAESLIAVLRRSVAFVGYFAKPADEASQMDNEWAPALTQAPAPIASSPLAFAEEPAIRPAVRPDSGGVAVATANLPLDVEVDKIPIRLSGGRRAWLYVPSPFYIGDKERIKAQVDLLLADDEDAT